MAKEQTDQIVITQEDLDSNVYVFGPDVEARFKLGVSPTGHTEKEPLTTVNLVVSYEGATLADTLRKVDQQHGVNTRRSLRDHKWLPENGSELMVLATNNAAVKMDSLPAETQALAYFSKIEDPQTRQNAIDAFLSINAS